MAAGMEFPEAMASTDGTIQTCTGRGPHILISSIIHLMRANLARHRLLPIQSGWKAGHRQTIHHQPPITALMVACSVSASIVMLVRSMSSSTTGMLKESPWPNYGLCTGTMDGRRLPSSQIRLPNRIDGGKPFRQIRAREEYHHYTSGCSIGNGLCFCADWLR